MTPDLADWIGQTVPLIVLDTLRERGVSFSELGEAGLMGLLRDLRVRVSREVLKQRGWTRPRRKGRGTKAVPSRFQGRK